jgi:predicted AAA+ superfamily ATPase
MHKLTGLVLGGKGVGKKSLVKATGSTFFEEYEGNLFEVTLYPMKYKEAQQLPALASSADFALCLFSVDRSPQGTFLQKKSHC